MKDEKWTETSQQLQMVGHIGRLRHLSFDSCSRGRPQGNRAAVLAVKACRQNHTGLGLVRRMPVLVLGKAGVAVQVHCGKWAADKVVVVGIAEACGAVHG